MPIRVRDNHHHRLYLMTQDNIDDDLDSVESTISRRGKWRICRYLASLWRMLCCFNVCVACCNEPRRQSGRHGSRKRTSSLIVRETIDMSSSSGRTRRTSSLEAVEDDIIEIELSVVNRLGLDERNLVTKGYYGEEKALDYEDILEMESSSPKTGLIGAPVIGIYHSRLS